MQRRLTRTCLIISFGVAILVSSVTGLAADSPSDKNGIEKLIERTKDEIARQKKQEKSVLNNLVRQQKELEKLEDNQAKLKKRLTSAEDQYKQTTQELNKIQRDLTSLEGDLNQRRKLLDQRLVALYKKGPQPYLEILLIARNYGDLISKFRTVSYIVKQDLSLLDGLVATKEQIGRKQETIRLKKNQAEMEFQKTVKLNNQVQLEQEKIVTKVKSTKQELAKIQNNREKLLKALEEYERTSREIENQIRKDQDRTVPGSLLGSGNMIWPARARISSDFGWRYHPVLKRKKYHNGIDLAVPSGTPVRAADSGVVLVSGWRGGYGYFVAIDHGNNISTCYAHNSRLLVKVGDKVEKGQSISLSGNTGLSTGPHLHFEVRLKGNTVNPISYLP